MSLFLGCLWINHKVGPGPLSPIVFQWGGIFQPLIHGLLQGVSLGLSYNPYPFLGGLFHHFTPCITGFWCPPCRILSTLCADFIQDQTKAGKFLKKNALGTDRLPTRKEKLRNKVFFLAGLIKGSWWAS